MSDAAARRDSRELVHPILLGVAVVAAGLLVWLNLRNVRAVAAPTTPVARSVRVADDRGSEKALAPVPAIGAASGDAVPAIDDPPPIVDPCSDEATACATRTLPKSSSHGFRKTIGKLRDKGDEIAATCIALRYVDRSDPVVAGSARFELARSWYARTCSDRALAALDQAFEVLPEGDDRVAACTLCSELRGETCEPCAVSEEKPAEPTEGSDEVAAADEPVTAPVDPFAEADLAAPVDAAPAPPEPTPPEPTPPEPTPPSDTPSAAAVTAKFHTRCDGAKVTTTGDVARLEGGWCYYIALPNPAKGDYTITFEARLVSGNGYGVWFNGSWSGNDVTAPGVQYDFGAGGLKFVDYPATERDVAPMKRAKMNGEWHRWVIQRTGDRITVTLDGAEIAQRNVGAHRQFGLRTWNSAVELRGATVTP